jgi:hypothetical protein
MCASSTGLPRNLSAPIDQLATLCLNEIHLPDQSISYQLPIPRDTIQKLLDAANVKLPTKIVPKKTNVTTKTKLTTRRISKKTAA